MVLDIASLGLLKNDIESIYMGDNLIHFNQEKNF